MYKTNCCWTAAHASQHMSATLSMAGLKLTFSLKDDLPTGSIPLVCRTMISCILPRSVVQPTVEIQAISTSRFFKSGPIPTSREAVRAPGRYAITVWAFYCSSITEPFIVPEASWVHSEEGDLGCWPRGFRGKRAAMIWTDQNRQIFTVKTTLLSGYHKKTTGSGPSLLWGPDPCSSHAVKSSWEVRSQSMSTPYVDPCSPIQSACRDPTQAMWEESHPKRPFWEEFHVLCSIAECVFPSTKENATQPSHEGRQAVANPTQAVQAENMRAICLNKSMPALRPALHHAEQ